MQRKSFYGTPIRLCSSGKRPPVACGSTGGLFGRMKLELVSKMVGVKTKMKLKLRGMKCRKKDNTCATLLDTLNG